MQKYWIPNVMTKSSNISQGVRYILVKKLQDVYLQDFIFGPSLARVASFLATTWKRDNLFKIL